MSNKNKTTASSSKLIVSGEDVESEDEVDLEPRNPVIAITDTDERSSSGVKVVTFQGEAPESDYEDFGSTISLDSANSMELDELDPDVATVLALAPILPQRRSPRLDPVTVRKHREKNKSLRANIADKFLAPVILQSAKKFEKLSHNLSNSQMQMQEALFQSRIATGNLLRLQKDLDNFLEVDYLKELKILPSDEDTPKLTTSSATSSPQSKKNSKKSDKTLNTSDSLLSAALSGGAHLI